MRTHLLHYTGQILHYIGQTSEKSHELGGIEVDEVCGRDTLRKSILALGLLRVIICIGYDVRQRRIVDGTRGSHLCWKISITLGLGIVYGF